MDIVSIIFQTITILAAFYVAFIIFRKNFEYIGNKLFIISFLLFGLYALVLLIYEFPISILINEILLNVSLYLVVIGVLFFVLSMQTFTQGSIFLKEAVAKLLIITTIIVCVIITLFPYHVQQIIPTIKADKSIVSLLATGLVALGFMIYNLIRIFIALNRIDESEKRIKRKIMFLGVAQAIGLMSPVMSVIGNVTKNDLVHGLMFLFLAIPMVIVGILISKGKGDTT